jgi:hypothetical protein
MMIPSIFMLDTEIIFKGIVFLATHKDLYKPLFRRLTPTLGLGTAVTLFMFLYTTSAAKLYNLRTMLMDHKIYLPPPTRRPRLHLRPHRRLDHHPARPLRKQHPHHGPL